MTLGTRPDKWRELLRRLPGLTISARRILEHIAFRAYSSPECAEYQYNIAQEMCVDERTVRRAVEVLRIGETPEDSGAVPVLLVLGRTRGKSCKRYAIDWDAVEAFAEGRRIPRTTAPVGAKSVPVAADGPDKMSGRTGQNVRSDRTKCPVEPDKMSGRRGSLYIPETRLKKQETGPSRGNVVFGLAWGEDFSRSLLNHGPSVQGAFESAVRAGVISSGVVDRLRFFTAAAYVVRCSDPRSTGERITNPGGYFRTLVERALWGTGSQADEERARRMIRSLDRCRSPERESNSPVAALAKSLAAPPLFSMELETVEA